MNATLRVFSSSSTTFGNLKRGSPLGPHFQQSFINGDLDFCCGALRKYLSEDDGENFWMIKPQATAVIDSALKRDIAALVLSRPTDPSKVSGLKEGSLHLLANLSSRMDRWEESLHFCGQMKGTGPSPAFISQNVRPGNIQIVRNWCAHHEIAFDVPKTLAVLGRDGHWEEALELARNVEQSQLRGGQSSSIVAEKYSLGVVIPYLRSGGDWVTSMRLVCEAIMQGSLRDERIMEDMVLATSTPKRWETALGLISLAERTMMLPRISTARPFRALMKVCPYWESAIGLVQCVRRRGLAVDELMLTTSLSLCDRHQQWEAASQLYEIVRKDRNALVKWKEQQSYKTILRDARHEAHAERVRDSHKWMHAAGDASHSVGIQNVINICERSGKWEMVLKVSADRLKDMNQATSLSSLSLEFPQSTITSILNACALGKQWDTAISLYIATLQSSNRDNNVNPISSCSVLQACLHAQKWEKGLEFFSFLEDHRTQVIIPPVGYSLAMGCCLQTRQWGTALMLLRTIREHGLPSDNHGQRLGLWATALTGRWRECLEYFNELPVISRSRNDDAVVRLSSMAAGPLALSVVTRVIQNRQSRR